MREPNITKSVKLSTGHTVYVVFPGDEQFRSKDQLRLAMLETSLELRKLAEAVQAQAIEAGR